MFLFNFFRKPSVKKRVLAYSVVFGGLNVIIIVCFPDSIKTIIITLLFLTMLIVARYDKKMKEHYRRYSNSPKWLKSEWTFWILITLIALGSISHFLL